MVPHEPDPINSVSVVDTVVQPIRDSVRPSVIKYVVGGEVISGVEPRHENGASTANAPKRPVVHTTIGHESKERV